MRIRGIVLTLTLMLALAGLSAVASAEPKKGSKPLGSGTSLGDPLFPQIGNTGYDARSYRIKLDYDPAANVFNSAKTRIVAVATKSLSKFSLDFQDLDVKRVKVNGARAKFAQVEAKPDLSPLPEVTQPMKLVVRPEDKLRKGRTFKVKVRYSGTPQMITDADTSVEGWIPACQGAGMTPPCDGAFVVNQPIGAQGWFPSNNYPTDKATFSTRITVPTTHAAFGIGELGSRDDNGDGTWTWNWSEDDPTSTYLTTATVGLFDYTASAMLESSTGRTLAVNNALDSSFTPTQKAKVNGVLA
jgi:aminopeptidase N